jgi:enamine deaminase RidA (YjgF/YER057c/UK114 family)
MSIKRIEPGPRMSRAVVHGDTVYLPGVVAGKPDTNGVWDAWVEPGNTPARATVEARLASPNNKVEIMMIAAL